MEKAEKVHFSVAVEKSRKKSIFLCSGAFEI